MKPRPTVRLTWNAGRNGWHSFMLGASWQPKAGALHTPRERRRMVREGGWLLHVYLGLWALTIQGPTY